MMGRINMRAQGFSTKGGWLSNTKNRKASEMLAEQPEMQDNDEELEDLMEGIEEQRKRDALRKHRREQRAYSRRMQPEEVEQYADIGDQAIVEGDDEIELDSDDYIVADTTASSAAAFAGPPTGSTAIVPISTTTTQKKPSIVTRGRSLLKPGSSKSQTKSSVQQQHAASPHHKLDVSDVDLDMFHIGLQEENVDGEPMTIDELAGLPEAGGRTVNTTALSQAPIVLEDSDDEDLLLGLPQQQTKQRSAPKRPSIIVSSAAAKRGAAGVAPSVSSTASSIIRKVRSNTVVGGIKKKKTTFSMKDMYGVDSDDV
eukprot:TRINITY_DN7429_c0_g1_i6.p1 TRINITY_DN7429_c0_g1~~TRINITY_DN7429_c0_g1_i6.p1  ORF type:complete len:313 (+),score=48.04 TRINITY_DN7429_c0_g1_i6:344-1282(+)